MIWELEMQCLQLYQSKVEEAANIKARLHQSVAAKEAELATLLTSLGEPNNHPRREVPSLLYLLLSVAAILAAMLVYHSLLLPTSPTAVVECCLMPQFERQFTDTKLLIEKIAREISGYGYNNSKEENTISLDVADLSLRKLAEYETCLRTLQREKERLVSILDDYKFSRKQKQEEKRRQRKLQDMCLSAMEAKYGSRPSPRKSPSFRKSNGYSVNGNRFLEEMRRLSTAPSNYLAISKEDAKSTYTCICGYEASSPPHI
ncbi:hypothetical protein MLD38_037906 [Melastoma candidum]|uniref:Uncharacterized protein n=1 Tax=Melastoma candidum TaxID=119954 RepID=A0ACB9KY49_9MYRT|nr:hypothetical protein MLD38_037906 [Melastoma candidum]